MELIGGSIIGFVHVLTAVVLIGGSFLINYLVDPVTKDLEPPVAGKIKQALGMRFTILAWVSILLLLATGIIRVVGSGKVQLDTLFSSSYGQVLVFKIILFLIATVIAGMITANGKKLEGLAKESPPPADVMAQLSGKIGNYSKINLYIGIVIIFASVLLRFINA